MKSVVVSCPYCDSQLIYSADGIWSNPCEHFIDSECSLTDCRDGVHLNSDVGAMVCDELKFEHMSEKDDLVKQYLSDLRYDSATPTPPLAFEIISGEENQTYEKQDTDDRFTRSWSADLIAVFAEDRSSFAAQILGFISE